MTPDGLRCESRRRASAVGVWRYSLAALIVAAAFLDVVWWVPYHGSPDQRIDAAVAAHMPRCRQVAAPVPAR